MTRLAFSERARLSERIDDPELPEAVFAAAMRDLERVNRVLRAYRPTLAFLDRFRSPGRVLRVLDVGSGQGDHLRAIARWAAKYGQPIEGIGLDLSPAAVRSARAAASPELPIRFVIGDVFAYRPDPPPDLIVSSLFTHHLGEGEIIHFLQWMEETATLGWQVSDLHRHPLAWLGFRALARVAGWHPVVRHDGAVSVLRGFTRADWRRYLQEAGMEDTTRIRGRLPFLYTVERQR